MNKPENILASVQNFVVEKLLSDETLSGETILAENRRDIESEIKTALGKQGRVTVVMTPAATYQGSFEDKSLTWQIDELEVDVVENVPISRGKGNEGKPTGQDVAMRVFDVLCPLSGDNEGQFSPVSYAQGEDASLLVNKCVLRCLVHKT